MMPPSGWRRRGRDGGGWGRESQWRGMWTALSPRMTSNNWQGKSIFKHLIQQPCPIALKIAQNDPTTTIKEKKLRKQENFFKVEKIQFFFVRCSLKTDALQILNYNVLYISCNTHSFKIIFFSSKHFSFFGQNTSFSFIKGQLNNAKFAKMNGNIS